MIILKKPDLPAERIACKDASEFEQLAEEHLHKNRVSVPHPSIANISILYDKSPGQKNNFRLSARGDWVHGNAIFYSTKNIKLSEDEADFIIRSFRQFIITKTYLGVPR